MKVHAGLGLTALVVGLERVVSSTSYVAQHLYSTSSCPSKPTGIFMTPADSCVAAACSASDNGLTSSSAACALDPEAYAKSVFGGLEYFLVVAYEEKDEGDEDEVTGKCDTIASAIAIQATGACELITLGKVKSAMASVNLDGSGSLSLYTDDSCMAVIQSISATGENVNSDICTSNNKFYSSVIPPATFALQGFYRDETCSLISESFVSIPSDACSSVSCSADSDLSAYTSTQCTTNSTAAIKSAFGSSSYLMVVNYDVGTGCDTESSVKAYLADGTCHIINDGSTRSSSVVLSSDGSAMLSLYTDVACTQGVQSTSIAATSINSDVCKDDVKYFSSAKQAKMFVTQDYHKDSECSSTMTAFVSVPLDSCTDATTCNTAGSLNASMDMHCTTDHIAYANSAFGNNGYLMFVGYIENTNCAVIDWVFAHLADGACQIVSLEKAASAKAYLNSDGSATLIYYNDTECTTGGHTQQIPELALNNDSCTSTVKYIAGYATSNGTLVYTDTMENAAPSRTFLVAAATAIGALAMVF
ncbi:unnamed protein product [Phytophthora lilii]|uniref:Unnamed protein product n=1 Tax=Phytophthora lilii TaxID=2077276 RepID=A0A9W6TNR5_9STRA|nr:unnamed protein product [Phytophthora lilii]